jgi:hypothetical protein
VTQLQATAADVGARSYALSLARSLGIRLLEGGPQPAQTLRRSPDGRHASLPWAHEPYARPALVPLSARPAAFRRRAV